MKYLKRTYYYFKYHLWNDFKKGGRIFGKYYVRLAQIWNPKNPFFNPKFPNITIPDEYVKTIICAYWTGEGWMLEWGLQHKDGIIDSLIDVTYFNDIELDQDDAIIFDWPFVLPVGGIKEFERIGFYIV